MELAGLFLLLLLPPPEATGEIATAIGASLRHELGDVVLAVAPETLVTPAMLQAENSSIRARFVARVTWTGKDRIAVEVFANSKDERDAYRVTRELKFSSLDSKPERGRSIGLVVAGLLREIPAAALALRPAPLAEASVADRPADFALGGLFVLESPRAGVWAMGPMLRYDFRLASALHLCASGGALVAEGFTDIGVGMELRWHFLRSAGGRHAVAMGAGLLVLHESASSLGEHSRSTSQWNGGMAVGLSAQATVWKSLRVVGQMELRVLGRAMSLAYGEEPVRTRTFSTYRPVVGGGLEYAF